MNEPVGYCRHCGEMILFLPTARGRLAPCEPNPVRYLPSDRGIRLYTDDGHTVRGRVVDDRLEGAARGWMGHFNVSPECARTRNRGKRQRQPDPAVRAENERRAEAWVAAEIARRFPGSNTEGDREHELL